MKGFQTVFKPSVLCLRAVAILTLLALEERYLQFGDQREKAGNKMKMGGSSPNTPMRRCLKLCGLTSPRARMK